MSFVNLVTFLKNILSQMSCHLSMLLVFHHQIPHSISRYTNDKILFNTMLGRHWLGALMADLVLIRRAYH